MEATNLGEADGLPTLDWSHVEAQLADLLTHDDPRSPNRSTFWLTTLNGDGSPHVTSVGALWHAGSCWFQTGERTRKAQNVARDPRCTMSVATGGFDVTVSGEARRVTDPTIVAEIAALWATSGWPAQPDDSGTGITAPFNAPDARTAAVVRLRSEAAHRDRSWYGRRDAGFDALAVLRGAPWSGVSPTSIVSATCGRADSPERERAARRQGSAVLRREATADGTSLDRRAAARPAADRDQPSSDWSGRGDLNPRPPAPKQ